MLDLAIGPIKCFIDKHSFQMNVTHIGTHNQYSYKNLETVLIAKIDKEADMNRLVGCVVRCHVRYRDEYNRLFAEVEVV